MNCGTCSVGFHRCNFVTSKPTYRRDAKLRSVQIIAMAHYGTGFYILLTQFLYYRLSSYGKSYSIEFYPMKSTTIAPVTTSL
ncbi:MAG TPA: hypothetical protein EYP10_06725, partial [Armatimonadetes bacterium]|nr:hypothetical protein [Armatimonadota bacterium]